ncbi:protein of unknown function [Bradyrhizobium vignae]|uniref:Uncharacterized protein n=1 Tax=Bradyrhizobium vignae TaxID=1549949 RepID=A0A2U3PZK4_9BRAD|nr:protein of unknown function [Bradyrhizobium vignae]
MAGEIRLSPPLPAIVTKLFDAPKYRPRREPGESGEACDRGHHSRRAADTKRIVNLTLTTQKLA